MDSDSNSTNYETESESFPINIKVDELKSDFKLIVKPSTNVSQLISRLITQINIKFDWSEYGLLNTTTNTWLLPNFTNLVHFDLNAESKIIYIPRYRYMNIQFPDLQIRQMYLDLSKTVYEIVEIICKKLSIRHHEELSIQYRKINDKSQRTKLFNKFKKNNKLNKRTSTSKKYALKASMSQQSMYQSNGSIRNSSHANYNDSLNRILYNRSSARMPSFFNILPTSTTSRTGTLSRTLPDSPQSAHYGFQQSMNNGISEDFDFESFETTRLANSPYKSYQVAVSDADIVPIKLHHDKLVHYPWLQSNKTLLNNGFEFIDPDSILLMLRFKYHSYYRLNQRFDEVRINQLFQQAKWSFLSNYTKCDEDEAFVLGGLLLHINNTSIQNNDPIYTSKENLDTEIDNMLDKLSLELLGKCENPTKPDEEEIVDEANSRVVINGYLKLINYPRKFYHRYQVKWGVLSKKGIELYTKTRRKFVAIIPIKGNKIVYRIKLVKKEIFILDICIVKKNVYNQIMNKNLDIKENNVKPFDRIRLRFYDEAEFAKWVTAVKLLSEGIDFTKVKNFQLEHHIISNIIDLKRRPELDDSLELSKEEENLDLNDLIGQKFNKLFKRKSIIKKLVLYRNSFEDFTNTESKMAYINCWLSLHEATIIYYRVQIYGSTELCCIGIGYGKIQLCDLEGNLWQIWELRNLLSWNTNWQTNKMILEFNSDKIQIEFESKQESREFHEFIGGYLFIMMRNSEKHQDLSKHVFLKMTSTGCD